MEYSYGDKSATDKKIKLMIPILIQWARKSWDEPHFYGELANLIGASPRSIGKWLGMIHRDVIKRNFPNAPTLNALVCNKQTKLPGEGIDVVKSDYSECDKEKQKEWVYKANKDAHEYNWNPVLQELGLKPIKVVSKRKFNQYLSHSGHSGKGGEGKLHKKLKEYILNHPESIGIQDCIKFSKLEHELHSLDKIDVYFETPNNTYAVEVKSEISNDDDIIRGIFQAVKYKTLLEAQSKIYGDTNTVHSILVISRPLPDEGRTYAKILDVTVIENFKI